MEEREYQSSSRCEDIKGDNPAPAERLRRVLVLSLGDAEAENDSSRATLMAWTEDLPALGSSTCCEGGENTGLGLIIGVVPVSWVSSGASLSAPALPLDDTLVRLVLAVIALDHELALEEIETSED